VPALLCCALPGACCVHPLLLAADDEEDEEMQEADDDDEDEEAELAALDEDDDELLLAGDKQQQQLVRAEEYDEGAGYEVSSCYSTCQAAAWAHWLMPSGFWQLSGEVAAHGLCVMPWSSALAFHLI
jgi:hypothetical protein